MSYSTFQDVPKIVPQIIVPQIIVPQIIVPQIIQQNVQHFDILGS